MGYYQEVDEMKDLSSYEEEMADASGQHHYPRKSHNWSKRNNRKPKNLFPKIEAQKTLNKQVRIGGECICPICGQIYTKVAYQQVYCGIICREEFDRRRWVKGGHKIK